MAIIEHVALLYNEILLFCLYGLSAEQQNSTIQQCNAFNNDLISYYAYFLI